MIYPKNNLFVVSTNPHSIGLQNNMTSKPTFGSQEFLNEMATTKAGLTASAIKKAPGCKNLVPGMPIR